ncbi:glycosyltransferase family 39 protein [Geobacter sp.]|uniref:ArnT family glycosyltransferase n=1 Tax=Geobacter sp. TaxID=46610 RepID=UPI0027B97C3F|nr:glycosyltransferase family 39 protein [Geobacter sp.]
MDATGTLKSEVNPRHVFLLLAGYFALHLLFRCFVSDSIELDEAEQLLLTQELRLGYGSQPPLYTWLQAGVFSLLGTNVFALAVVKNILLFLTYFFVYSSTKEITNDNNRAIIAMVSLLLIPQIFWESQRDLTHSVLGTTVASCTLFVTMRLLKTGKPAYYVLLGLCAGFGIVSKYNYAVFLVALLLALCSLKNLRAQLLNRKILISIICMLLVTSPHLYWAITNVKATLSQVDKFQISRSLGLLPSYLLGLQKLIRAVASFVGLLLPVYALFFYRKGTTLSVATDDRDYPLLIQRTLLAGLVLCLLMILFFKVTLFKDRWMQPVLFATPVYLATLPWARLTPVNARRYAQFTVLIAMAVLLLMPGRTIFASQLDTYNRLNSPYSALSAQLRDAGFKEGVIVAQSRLMGGNLKMFFPGSVVLAPEVPLFRYQTESDWLIVWDATKRAEMPDRLREFATRLAPTDLNALQPRYVQSLYKYSTDRSMRLGFLLVRREAR